jgi:hypothetical protein
MVRAVCEDDQAAVGVSELDALRTGLQTLVAWWSSKPKQRAEAKTHGVETQRVKTQGAETQSVKTQGVETLKAKTQCLVETLKAKNPVLENPVLKTRKAKTQGVKPMQKPKAKTLAAEVLKPKGSKPKGWASSREVENVSRFKEGCVLACASGAG